MACQRSPRRQRRDRTKAAADNTGREDDRSRKHREQIDDQTDHKNGIQEGKSVKRRGQRSCNKTVSCTTPPRESTGESRPLLKNPNTKGPPKKRTQHYVILKRKKEPDKRMSNTNTRANTTRSPSDTRTKTATYLCVPHTHKLSPHAHM